MVASPDAIAAKKSSREALPYVLLSVYLGVVYAVVLLGYYVAQSYVVALYPSYAQFGWAIIYAFYATGSFVAPIIPHLPLRRSITAAAISYIGYIACVNSGYPAAYLVGCVFVGTAAGVIWFMQGRYLMRLAAHSNSSGLVNAVFWSIFYTQNMAGSSIGLGVLYGGLNLTSLLWIMCGCSGLGATMSLFIQPVKGPVGFQKRSVTIRLRIALMYHTLLEPAMLLLLPLIVLQAIGLVVTYQVIPRSIFAISTASEAPINNALVFLVYGCGTIVGAFGSGKLFDLRGWKAVLWPLCAIELASSVFIIVFTELRVGPPLWWMVIGFLRGLADTSTNSLLCSTITTLRFNNYVQQRPDGLVFGLYRFLYCIAFVPISITSGYVPYFVIIAISMVAVSLSALCYALFFVRLPVPLAVPEAIPEPHPESLKVADASNSKQDDAELEIITL